MPDKRTYKVVGDQKFLGHQPGEVFEAVPDEMLERNVERGVIKETSAAVKKATRDKEKE